MLAVLARALLLGPGILLSGTTVFGLQLWQDLLAAVGGGSLLWLIDRGGRMVSESMDERHTREDREERAVHTLLSWAWGLPETDDRPAVPGFVRQTWPEFQIQFAALQQDVSKVKAELTNNGGSSTKDKIDRLYAHLVEDERLAEDKRLAEDER